MSKKLRKRSIASSGKEHESRLMILDWRLIIPILILSGVVFAYILSSQLIKREDYLEARDNRQGVTITVDSEIPIDLREVLIKAVEEWLSRYECGQDQIEIELSPIPILDTKSEEKYTLGEASAGRIKISSDFMRQLANHPDILRNIALHEIGHACVGEKINLDTPIIFNDGEVVWVQGLTLGIRLNNGQEYKFALFEEALAEYLAKKLPNYKSYGHSGYARIADLLAGTSVNAELLVISDLKGFIAAACGVDPNCALYPLMASFDNAFSNSGN